MDDLKLYKSALPQMENILKVKWGQNPIWRGPRPWESQVMSGADAGNETMEDVFDSCLTFGSFSWTFFECC